MNYKLFILTFLCEERSKRLVLNQVKNEERNNLSFFFLHFTLDVGEAVAPLLDHVFFTFVTFYTNYSVRSIITNPTVMCTRCNKQYS